MKTIYQILALLAIKELETKTLRERIVMLEEKVRNLEYDNKDLANLVTDDVLKKVKKDDKHNTIGFNSNSK